MNVKSISKGRRKRCADMEPISMTNIGEFSGFMCKFVSWLNDWMLSGKRGLSKQTFSSCIQTSSTFPLLLQHLLEVKQLSYILTGNIQSDPLEKRFGRYRQLSGANYFGSVRQFLDAEKSIRVKSLIKFSGYTMREVNYILGKDEAKMQSEVKFHGNAIIEMLLPKPDVAQMTGIDADIVYYVAGFISKSVKKTVKCTACGNMLGDNSEMKMRIEGLIPENCQSFVDEINRGGLIKPSDIVFITCVISWDVYSQIMENIEAKSTFMSSKMHRRVFNFVVQEKIKDDDRYIDILKTTCLQNHLFVDLFTKVVNKFFNCMCKNFASEINSNVHRNKKRNNVQNISEQSNKPTRNSTKIRKLQSEK